MKILIYSPSFLPNVGGLENVVYMLAQEFGRLGQDVQLVTTTATNSPDQFGFETHRNPSRSKLIDLTRWCDVFFQACVSLKGLWPLFFVRRPLIVTHQVWYDVDSSTFSWRARAKRLVTLFSRNVAVCSDIAAALPGKSVIIPNCYRDDIYRQVTEMSRTGDIVFVGRLVSDKGVALLLEALALLGAKGIRPSLTIVGSGPEEPLLRRQAEQLGLLDQAQFLGTKLGPDLVRIVSDHKIMVVPSLWREPFGIVALEGIACGCVVIGSEGGGLKDAIGPCGLTFPNGDANSLATCMERVLTNDECRLAFQSHSGSHLRRHTMDSVSRAYLEVFEKAIHS